MTQFNRFRSVEEALRVLDATPSPDPGRRDEARASMLALVDAQRLLRSVSDAAASSPPSEELGRVRPWWGRLFSLPVTVGNRRPALLTVVGAVLLAVVVVTGGAVVVDAAIPGDAFYGVDRFIEHARLRLASTDAGRVGLQTAFAEERLDELERIEGGSLADVDGVVILSGLDESAAALQSLLEQGRLSAEAEAEIQSLRNALLARRQTFAGMDDVDDELEVDLEDDVPDADNGVMTPDVDDLTDGDGDDVDVGDDLWVDEDEAEDDVDGEHTSVDEEENHSSVDEDDGDTPLSTGGETDGPDDDAIDTNGEASDDDDDSSASDNDTSDDDSWDEPGEGDDDAPDAGDDAAGGTSGDDDTGDPDDGEATSDEGAGDASDEEGDAGDDTPSGDDLESPDEGDALSHDGDDPDSDAEDDAVDGTSIDEDTSAGDGEDVPSDDDTGSSGGEERTDND